MFLLLLRSYQEMLKVTAHTGSSKFSGSGSLKKDDLNRGQIDTASPFESVKAAINKFRGFADCEAQTDLSTIEVGINRSEILDINSTFPAFSCIL